jgi:putative heme-binding domain-containing protein
LKSDDTELRLEAVRTISLQSRPERFTVLAEIAGKETYDEAMRLEAITGLGAAAKKHGQLLRSLAQSDHASIRREAARSLRLGNAVPTSKESKPAATDIDAWLTLMEQTGDSDAGKRLFFSPVGPFCARCHRFEGRGVNLAPDLTQIGQQQSRRRILTSILQPSNEIALQFIPWILHTDRGKVYTGLPAKSTSGAGIEEYYDAEGKLFFLPIHTIEERQQSSISIMPDGLDKLLTVDDLRDLLALLMSSSHANPSSDFPHN